MSFIISGLPIAPFTEYFGRPAEFLAQLAIRRSIADTMPGFPCRVSLEDAQLGESVLLLNYVHQPAETPFRASHAIFVRENASATASFVDTIPSALSLRPLSVRAFDLAGMMVDADLVDGTQLDALIERLFANDAAAYLHVHYAKRGCYAARIDRSTSTLVE